MDAFYVVMGLLFVYWGYDIAQTLPDFWRWRNDGRADGLVFWAAVLYVIATLTFGGYVLGVGLRAFS